MSKEKVKEKNEKENSTSKIPVKKRFNIYGVLSFIISLAGIFYFGVPIGVIAIIFGIIGINKYDDNTQKGNWISILGFCIGTIDILSVIILSYIFSN